MKKKILIANSHIPWGGLGRFTITLAKGLKNAGYKVYGLVTHRNDQLYDEFSANTIETEYLGDFSKLKKYFRCVKTINKIKPDIIIINYLGTVHITLPFIRKSGVISIIHSDDNDYYRIASINKKYVNKWIAPSKKVYEGFLKYLKTEKYKNRISVIPHGVIKISSKARLKNLSTFNLVFIGALFRHKGVDLLPEIFSRFRSECTDSFLTIVGEGELQPFLADRFDSLGLNKSVKFTGVITNSEVRELLSRMDVLLFPTRLESFGLVIAEAMMEGVVPVVTLLKGITDEIVEDGRSGFLIEKDNTADFTDQLVNLYRNRDRLCDMANRAMAEAREEFSEEVMIKRYIRELQIQ